MILLTTSVCCVFDSCSLLYLFIGVKRLLVHVLFISTVLKPMLRLVSQGEGSESRVEMYREIGMYVRVCPVEPKAFPRHDEVCSSKAAGKLRLLPKIQ